MTEPCGIDGCPISTQEHHRLAVGMRTELERLRSLVRAPDPVDLGEVTSADLLAEVRRRMG